LVSYLNRRLKSYNICECVPPPEDVIEISILLDISERLVIGRGFEIIV
jgi:hypothetical protein